MCCVDMPVTSFSQGVTPVDTPALTAAVPRRPLLSDIGAAHGRAENAGKPRVLVFVAVFVPGYKAGGPTRTIANLVEHLGDEFEFRIVTSDRDLGDEAPYPGVRTRTWLPVGKAHVWYEPPSRNAAWRMWRVLKATPHDVLYLNSFFSVRFTLHPLIAHRFSRNRAPIVIAPRGEFSPGALSLKRWKKRPYIALFRLLGLLRRAHWQASSSHEAEMIAKAIADNLHVAVAPDLPGRPREQRAATSVAGSERPRVLFLSRISPMKNLTFALRVLRRVDADIDVTIRGPQEDATYWSQCEELIDRLPPNVRVSVRPAVEPAEVPGIMADHDLFFLPTLGENFGHVIAEALSVGTPVLISDQTPWRKLERDGLGWDLPLSDEDAFARAIEQVAAMTPADRSAWRNRVRSTIAPRLVPPEAIEQNRWLFLDAIASNQQRRSKRGT